MELVRRARGGRTLIGMSPGIRYMIAGAFCFSVMTLAVKLVGTRIPSQQVVLIRGVLTLVLTYGLIRRAGLSARGSRPAVLMLRGLFGYASLSCLYFSVVRLPLADATVLQYTNPMWTAVLAVWFLGERMRGREVAAVAASLTGVVLIARPTFLFGAGAEQLDLLAVGVSLLGALLAAAAYVTVRQLARTEHPLTIVFYFTLVTVPAALPGTLANLVWPTPAEWLLLLVVGVAAQVGQVYLTRGLQLEPAGRATAAGYMQIVFAGLWGVLFFRDVPDAPLIAGTLIILASTLMLGRPPTQPGVPRNR